MSAVFALIAALGWGSSDYVGGRASRNSSAVSVVVLTHFASMLALAVIALVPGQTGDPTAADLAWGLAAGVGGGAGAMLLFRGLGCGSMSVVAPITAVGAASVPALAGLVQGESIGLLGIGGMLCALVAIVLVSLSADDSAAGETATVGVGDLDVDGEIARFELEFAESSDDPTAAAAPAGGASPWSAPTGPRVAAEPPRRTFRDLAVEMHVQRDRFESALAGVAAVPSGHVTAMRSASAPAFPPPTTAPGAPLPPPPIGPAPVPTDTGSVATLTAPPSTAPPVAPTAPVAFVETTPTTVDPATQRPDTTVAGGSSASGLGRAGRSLAALLRQPGVVDALFSGIGFGLFFVFIARASEEAGHWPLVGARGISALMFTVIALVTTTAVLPERRARRGVIVAGLLDAGAAVCFVLATQSGLLSVGAVLASLYPAATVLLARFVDDERISRVQMGGLVLAGAAVSLLAL